MFRSAPLPTILATFAFGLFIACFMSIGEATSTAAVGKPLDVARPLSSLLFDPTIPASNQAVQEDERLSAAIITLFETGDQANS